MVSFTALVSAISMALLTSTANAAPCAPDYTAPPPTDSVLDFTLYKTNGNELQCWTHAPGNSVVHVAPKETGKCITADFYALNIDSNHNGVYGCKSMLFDFFILTIFNRSIVSYEKITDSTQQSKSGRITTAIPIPTPPEPTPIPTSVKLLHTVAGSSISTLTKSLAVTCQPDKPRR